MEIVENHGTIEKEIRRLSPMWLSVDSVVSMTRTTTCDLMSITNTHISVQTEPEIPKTRKSKAYATLPYSESVRPPLPQGDTFFSKFKSVEIRESRSEELKEERRAYFQKLEEERAKKKKIESQAVTRIQAIVRGFLIRPRQERPRPSLYPPLKVCSPASNEARLLQEELCAYAVQLGLKPIPGLSLEARSKHNKRKNQIEFAASLRIQSFFRMVIALLKVKKAAQGARKKLQHKSSLTIQKFFHYVLWKVKRCKRQDESREKAAILIQTRVRMFQAFHRVRRMLKEKKRLSRDQDARIVINRSITRSYRIWQKKQVKTL